MRTFNIETNRRAVQPAHLDFGMPSTFVNLFSGLETGELFGDVTQETIGPGFSARRLTEQSASVGVNLTRQWSAHVMKFGWDGQHTRVDGTEGTQIFDLVLATVDDFERYDLENSGVHATLVSEGLAPTGDAVHLRNTYNGLFAQDDWKLSRTVTLNLGLRWDRDSEFPNKTDFAPRLGVSWSPNTKTVLNASWGTFYDHFRMGVARQIPAFGGAAISEFQDIGFPRLFYGVPTVGPLHYGGLCLSPSFTDAEIAASGITCDDAGQQLYGMDHLNGVVAENHAPLPPDTVVTQATVASLTGLTPEQFAGAASAAVGRQPGFFSGDLRDACRSGFWAFRSSARRSRSIRSFACHMRRCSALACSERFILDLPRMRTISTRTSRTFSGFESRTWRSRPGCPAMSARRCQERGTNQSACMDPGSVDTTRLL